MIKTLIYRSHPLKDSVKDMHAHFTKHQDGKGWTGENHFVKHYAVLVRGDHEVNSEKLTQVLNGESVALVDDPREIEQITGAKVGFAGPIGLVGKSITTIIDHAVAAMAVGVTGANKTDYHTKNVVPGRDFPLEGDNIIVADIRSAVQGDTCKGKKLLFRKGIEVGQVFKLGTKYSKKLSCTFLDENGTEKPPLMGCYGIGINRIVASAIENGHDKHGIIWPISIAPFEVLITTVNQDDKQVAEVSEKIYNGLIEKGVDLLWDDRDMRAGAKFKDADLIGIPVRITIGKKSIAEGNVEIVLRSESEKQTVSISDAVSKTIEIVNKLKQKLTL